MLERRDLFNNPHVGVFLSAGEELLFHPPGITPKEVRLLEETLQDLEDLVDAHVDGKRIVLQMASPGTCDDATLGKLLKTEKVKIVKIQRNDALRF